MLIILGREVANPRFPGIFFKALIQAVLIFWAETWIMTPCMGWNLGGFQHRVAQQITGRKPRRLLYGVWDYPPLDTAIQEKGFE